MNIEAAQPTESVQPPPASAIIPAYNAQAYITVCLASVLRQARSFDIEAIVVDDDSTDATVEIVRGTAGVRCVTQPNRGPSAARNLGIAAARGQYIAFLDADDLRPPGRLQAQVRLLQQYPELALAFGDCRQFDANGQRPRTEFQANRLGAVVCGPRPTIPDACGTLSGSSTMFSGTEGRSLRCVQVQKAKSC